MAQKPHQIRISDYKYHELKTHTKIYLTRFENGKTIYQHREIMEAFLGRKLISGEYIDHVDGNGLNNHISNLRICTHLENMRNRIKTKRKCTSKYKGVNFYKRDGTWEAKTTINYKAVYLGRYKTELEAALVYDAYVIKHFGEFARPNFPKGELVA